MKITKKLLAALLAAGAALGACACNDGQTGGGQNLNTSPQNAQERPADDPQPPGEAPEERRIPRPEPPRGERWRFLRPPDRAPHAHPGPRLRRGGETP